MFVKYWQPDMTVDHILERVGREPLNSHYYAVHYPRVHAAAVRIWGSWRATITACGLDYNEIRKTKKWSRELVLNQVKRLSEENKPLSSKYVQTHYRDLYLAALRRFGSWGGTLKIAGLDYRGIRLRRHLSEAELKEQILALYRSGESLAYSNMRVKHQYLLASGAKKLGGGSWERARFECGIADNYRSIGQKSARLNRLNYVQRELF